MLDVGQNYGALLNGELILLGKIETVVNTLAKYRIAF